MHAAGGRPEANGVKLVCTAGPKAGQEYPLGRQDVVIGRATDNAISIPDTSVSRKHLKLQRTRNGWVAVDLGSGNGTLVNGEPITDEMALANGDVLALGDTEFTFVDDTNATDRREAPARRPGSEVPLRGASGRPVRVRSRSADARPRRGRRRGPLLLLLFLFLVVVGSLASLKIYTQKKLLVERRRQQEIADIKAEINAVFQEGKNLVLQGKWVDAKVKFEQVRERDPTNEMVQGYLDSAHREIPNQALLDAAEAALKENKLTDAVAALAKVSQETRQFERRDQLEEQVERRHAERMAEAEEAMRVATQVSICNPPPGGRSDASKYEEVVAITADLLQAFPEDRDAKTLHEDAREQASACQRVGPPVRSGRGRAREAEEVARMFADGEPAGALQAAHACASRSSDCRQKETMISEFMALYKKLDDLDPRGLSQLLSLDRKITGGRGSKMGRNAGTKAANVFYKRATPAKASGDYGRASELARKALEADPTHVGARALVEELRGMAKDLYFQAYTIRDQDPDGAAQKFKEVISMTPPGDEWHRKAATRLQELGK